jgi:hypothetical protein
VTDGRTVWPVRRWISDIGGKVRIAGTVARGALGDGGRAVILVDGVEVFAADVGGADGQAALAYEVDAPVEEGSSVDFALTPGMARTSITMRARSPQRSIHFDDSCIWWGAPRGGASVPSVPLPK